MHRSWAALLGAEAPSATAAASASHPSAAAAGMWTQAQVRQALNDRYLIARRMEKTGLRRIIMACGCFVAYKFIKVKVLGKSDGATLTDG